MAVMSSPQRSLPDSPSRQLIRELSQLAVSSQEGFYAQLDRERAERERQHAQALSEAAAKHNRVRESVELVRQKLAAEVQAERDRRDVENRRELERHARERAERELEGKRREAEQARANEANKRRLEEIERSRNQVIEDAKLRNEQKLAEDAKRAQEEQEAQKRRADEARSRAQAALKNPQSNSSLPRTIPPSLQPTNHVPSPAPSAPAPPSSSQLVSTASQYATSNPETEAEHIRYLDIHRRLKELRQSMEKMARDNKGLKERMGNMRREIRKSVGQLVEGKGLNKPPLNTILTNLKRAFTSDSPAIPFSPFLAQTPASAPSSTGPALLIYLLNIFAKAIISQFINEAGPSPKAADPVGIIASHVFAHDDLKWNKLSLIDILLAKYHKVCPTIFGIYGPEDTARGKERLGWAREQPGGPFVPQQRHFERTTGLGAGYASLSLRNYDKARFQNPFPQYHYWQGLARIANVPPAELTQTHFILLKAMIENYETKFIDNYGGAAIAAMRLCLVQLPKRVEGSSASKSLAGLVSVLQKNGLVL